MQQATAAISIAVDPKTEADTRYRKARTARWFIPVLQTLRLMSGPGERCMYCSGSEASQVEHHRPKSAYPQQALAWPNLLWACGQCNQYKGQQFDSHNPPLDPVAENVWDYFFIDQYGNLRSRWNVAFDDLDPRAEATLQLLALDRQGLQESRHARLKDLRQKACAAIADLQEKRLAVPELEWQLLEWFEQPFQPDVADYFLAGPGANNENEPFKRLFELMHSSGT